MKLVTKEGSLDPPEMSTCLFSQMLLTLWSLPLTELIKEVFHRKSPLIVSQYPQVRLSQKKKKSLFQRWKKKTTLMAVLKQGTTYRKCIYYNFCLMTVISDNDFELIVSTLKTSPAQTSFVVLGFVVGGCTGCSQQPVALLAKL